MNRKLFRLCFVGIVSAIVAGFGFMSRAADAVAVCGDVSPSGSAEQTVCADADPFVGVREQIDSILNDGTEYSVCLAFPQKSAAIFVYNSHAVRSASMIKVFIMAAAMEKAKRGELDLDETMTLKASDKVGGAGILAGCPAGTDLPLREVLRLMITESDNTAANMVIDRLGMAAINDYIACNGYADTVLRRKMMDMRAINAGEENYSSAKDLGTIFLKLYKHECVDREHDETMLEFLRGQADTDCFPAALPGLVIAHKTGALIGLYDDGGIIYNGDNDAVLVIMTEHYTGESVAMSRMRQFARAVVGND